MAKSLARLNPEPPVRQDLIDRVRAEIEEGRYETPERIDGAIDSILRDFNKDLNPPA